MSFFRLKVRRKTDNNTISAQFMAEIFSLWFLIATLGFSVKTVLNSIPPVTAGILGSYILCALAYVLAIASGLGFSLCLAILFPSLVLISLYKGSIIPLGEFLRNHVVLAVAFLMFLVFKVYSPEIYWGEKFGELSFLYFFTRYDTLPAPDPWAYPNPLKYYFLHYLFLGGISKILKLDPTVMFNVAVVLVPAVVFVCIFEILVDQNRFILSSLCGSLLIFLSNVEAIRLFYISGKPWGFDTFWASTRAFPNHLFAEYPLWSFLFGDLHPHYMNYTLLAAVITASYFALKFGDIKTFFMVCFLAGASIGFNSWDTFTIAVFIGSISVFSLSNFWFSIKFAGLGSIAFFLGYILFKPLISGKSQLNFGFLNSAETMSFGEIFSHFGIFWAMNTICSVWFALKNDRIRALVGSILVSSCFYLASEYGVIPHKPTLVSFLVFSTTLNFWLGVTDEGKSRFGYITWVAGSLIVLITETIFIADRMNTVFKMYCFVWFLYSVSSAILLGRLFGEKILKYSVLFVIFTSAPTVYAMAGHSFEKGSRPSLRGDLFLFNENFQHDGEAIIWLRQQLDTKKLPLGTVLEATNDSYRGTNYVSAFVGLPTVLGWWHHAGVRGSPREDVETRKSEIISFYSDPTDTKLRRLHEKYSVRYIFFGKMERELYPSALISFESELLEKVFDNGKSAIYRVKL